MTSVWPLENCNGFLMFYRPNEQSLVVASTVICCCQIVLKPRIFSRFPKKTSKAWSELCGPRARHSEGKRWLVFKVISFKRLSCPKSAKSLLADCCGSALKGRDLTTKCGWGVWQCVRDAFVTRPFSLPPPLLGTRGPPLPALVVVALVYPTAFFSFLKAASSHSLTFMSTILY